MYHHRMHPMMFQDYVLVKKSTLFIAAAVATGLVCRHFYKHHRKEMDKVEDEMTDMIDNGKAAAAEAVENLKKK